MYPSMFWCFLLLPLWTYPDAILASECRTSGGVHEPTPWSQTGYGRDTSRRTSPQNPGSKHILENSPPRLARRMFPEIPREGHPERTSIAEEWARARDGMTLKFLESSKTLQAVTVDDLRRPGSQERYTIARKEWERSFDELEALDKRYHQKVHPLIPKSEFLMAGHRPAYWPSSFKSQNRPMSIPEIDQLRARMFADLQHKAGADSSSQGHQKADWPVLLQDGKMVIQKSHLANWKSNPKSEYASLSKSADHGEERHKDRASGASGPIPHEESQLKSKRKLIPVEQETESLPRTVFKRPARTTKLSVKSRNRILDSPKEVASQEGGSEETWREKLKSAGLSSPKSIRVKSIHRSDGVPEASGEHKPRPIQGPMEHQGSGWHSTQVGLKPSRSPGVKLPVPNSRHFEELVYPIDSWHTQPQSFLHHQKVDHFEGRGLHDNDQIDYLAKQRDHLERGGYHPSLPGPQLQLLPHSFHTDPSLPRAMLQGGSSSTHWSPHTQPKQPPLHLQQQFRGLSQHGAGLPPFAGSPQLLMPKQKEPVPKFPQVYATENPPTTYQQHPWQQPPVAHFGSPAGTLHDILKKPPAMQPNQPFYPPFPPKWTRADTAETLPPVRSPHPD